MELPNQLDSPYLHTRSREKSLWTKTKIELSDIPPESKHLIFEKLRLLIKATLLRNKQEKLIEKMRKNKNNYTCGQINKALIILKNFEDLEFYREKKFQWAKEDVLSGPFEEWMKQRDKSGHDY